MPKLNLKFMKPDIHPTYYPKTKVHCACGNTFTVGSTKPEISVEICSACHPLYTGKEKVIDTAGRVERFRKIVEKSIQKRAGIKPKERRVEKTSKSSAKAKTKKK